LHYTEFPPERKANKRDHPTDPLQNVIMAKIRRFMTVGTITFST
jgi:hypothetical protein